jgi:peptidoglycan/LPS O-acetylase OafA/YrhL
MPTMEKNGDDVVVESFFARPTVGTFLTVLSGLSFLFVCMILPLVGKAAILTDRYPKNRFWFTVALLVSLALGMLAIFSKMTRRKLDQSPLPLFSIALTGIGFVLLIALFAGLLHI